jgi:hypothetical protein
MAEAVVNTDGTSPGVEKRLLDFPLDNALTNPANIRRKMFSWMGMEVEEVVIKDWKPGLYKLIWSVKPLEHLVVKVGKDTHANPVVHCDYPTKDVSDEDVARRFVSEAFKRYWSSPESVGEFDKKYNLPAPA